MPRTFDGRIRLEPPAVKVREIKCSCSPFCQGASSRDWLTCTPGCRACRPDPWRAPTRTPPSADPSSHRTHHGQVQRTGPQDRPAVPETRH
jgi:hypothetical protein